MAIRLRKKREFVKDWIPTVSSIVALVLAVLVGFGVLTAEESAEAQAIITSAIGGVAAVVTAVAAIINLFFKKEEPVEPPVA